MTKGMGLVQGGCRAGIAGISRISSTRRRSASVRFCLKSGDSSAET